MSNLSYEEAKKHVFTGFWILLGVTLLEVLISLFGKGYIIGGVKDMGWLVAIAAIIIIALSIYKAKYIIYEFMHMAYEMKGLRFSVLLPTALLIWAIIAFFQEGSYWKNSRALIKEKNELEVKEPIEMQGYLLEEDIYDWESPSLEG